MNESPLFYAGLLTELPPVVDGKLDEICWQRAERTAPFVLIGGGKAPVETRGMVCWDEGRLYVAVMCGEPQIRAVKDRLLRGLFTFMEESVEVFVDSNHDHFTYLQFRVGIQGERDTHRGNDTDDSLTPRWRGAACVNEDNWTVEVAIPFSLLGYKPSSSALWGLNLNRQRCVSPDGMWTCWSDTKGGFHSPERFGHLVFGSYTDWLESYMAREVCGLTATAEELLTRWPQLSAVWQDHTQRIEKPYQTLIHEIRSTHCTTGEECSPLFLRVGKMVRQLEDALSSLRREVIRNEFM